MILHSSPRNKRIGGRIEPRLAGKHSVLECLRTPTQVESMDCSETKHLVNLGRKSENTLRLEKTCMVISFSQSGPIDTPLLCCGPLVFTPSCLLGTPTGHAYLYAYAPSHDQACSGTVFCRTQAIAGRPCLRGLYSVMWAHRLSAMPFQLQSLLNRLLFTCSLE